MIRVRGVFVIVVPSHPDGRLERIPTAVGGRFFIALFREVSN